MMDSTNRHPPINAVQPHEVSFWSANQKKTQNRNKNKKQENAGKAKEAKKNKNK
jgi:hypothetical protein